MVAIDLFQKTHRTLNGKTVKLIVIGAGKKRTYLILEATELVKKVEDERKAKLAV